MNNKFEKLTNSLEKLLKFFNEKKEEKFEAVKVKDSDTLIEYTALKEGADVSISTGSGSEVAPDGKYELTNEVTITVKDGKIETIEKPVEEEPAAEELAVEETEAEPAKEDATKAFEERVSAIEATLKELQEAIKAVPAKEDLTGFKNELKTVNEAITALSKVPTQFSADNRIEVKENEMDKYQRIAERYSK